MEYSLGKLQRELDGLTGESAGAVPQQEPQVTFTTTTVEGSSVAMCGTAEAYKHFYEKRGPEQELQAIRALCLDAGMHPDSTTLDYIRGAFYMLKAYVQKPAVPALPAPQEQDGNKS